MESQNSRVVQMTDLVKFGTGKQREKSLRTQRQRDKNQKEEESFGRKQKVEEIIQRTKKADGIQVREEETKIVRQEIPFFSDAVVSRQEYARACSNELEKKIAIHQHEAENANHRAEKAKMAFENGEIAHNDARRSQKIEAQRRMNRAEMVKTRKQDRDRGKERTIQLEGAQKETVRKGYDLLES